VLNTTSTTSPLGVSTTPGTVTNSNLPSPSTGIPTLPGSSSSGTGTPTSSSGS
jgi:hypothetical protein